MRRLGRIGPWWRRFKRNGYRRDRCAHCGHGFHWSRDARHSTGNRDGAVYHGPCSAYLHWRKKAEDRLTVVGAMSDLSGLVSSDVQGAMGLRGGSDESNVAWRVFYDLEKSTTTQDPS